MNEEIESVNEERLEQERLTSCPGGIIGPESRRTASNKRKLLLLALSKKMKKLKIDKERLPISQFTPTRMEDTAHRSK